MDAVINNKENLNTFEKSSVYSEPSLRKCQTPPLRTPLAEMQNQQCLNKSTKKAYYSQVTPVLRTPGTRRGARIKLSSLVYQDPTNVDDVFLNSLVCKKVQEVIASAKKEYEEKLQEKEQIILDLTSKIQSIKYNTEESCEQNYLDEEDLQIKVRCYVDNIIQKCVLDLQKQQTIKVPSIVITPSSPCATSSAPELAADTFTCNIDSHLNREDQQHGQKYSSEVQCVETLKLNGIHCDVGSFPLKLETRDCGTCTATETSDLTSVDTACSLQKSMSKDTHTLTDNNTHDVGQQTSVDVCDVWVMSRAEQDSVACSPFTNRQVGNDWHMKDQSVSPVCLTQPVDSETMTEKYETPPRHHASVQAVSQMVSVLCSPIHSSHQDSSVMAVPMTCNTGTDMPQVEYIDCAVIVKPDTQASYTMTERHVRNTETVMTPVKVQNKDGHRLTAEQVRKQHPRALANQLDTMTLTTQRLQKELNTVEKERDHFKSKITDLRSTLRQRQKSIDEGNQKIEEVKQELKEEHRRIIIDLEQTVRSKDEEILDLKTNMETLKKTMSETARKTGDEITALKDRCDTLLAEQQAARTQHELKVTELQQEMAKRDCTHQLKTAHALIQELQGELSEYTELADSLALAEKLQAQIQEVVTENYKKVKSAADRLMSLRKKTDMERQNVMEQKQANEEETERCKKEQEDILDQFESMKNTLATSRTSMVQMDSLYKSTSADLLCATNQVQILSSELVQIKKAYEDCQLSKSALIQCVEDQEEDSKAAFLEIQGLQASLMQQDKELERVNKQLTEVETKYKKKTETLETEKEQLELLTQNLQRTLDSREEDITHMEQEMYELRECVAEQMEKITNVESSSKTTAEDYRTCEAENMELRNRCAIMQASIQELKETVSTGEYELSAAKKQAFKMLQNRDEQLDDCAVCVQDLATRMTSLLTDLRNKVGRGSSSKTQTQNKECREGKEQKKLNRGRKSFVSQIFMAAGQSSPSSCDNPDFSDSSPTAIDSSGDNVSGVYLLSSDPESAEASPATVSRSKLGFSSSSAFAPVCSGSSAINAQPGPLSCQTVDATTKDQPELLSQLHTVDDYFCEIVRLANIIEKASRLSIEDLKSENDDLVNHIEQLENMQQELDSSVQHKDKELDICRETIHKMEQQLATMEENLARFYDQDLTIRDMKSELTQLKTQVRTLEGEKCVLIGQIKELSQNAGHTRNMSEGSVMDVLQLKMRNQKLRDQMLKKDEYYEEISSKASRRMKVLEENWKRAEAEVYKFDELVQLIGESLGKRKDLLSQNSDLRSLLKMINGHEVLPSEEKKPKPLKSIKTVI